MLEETNLVCPYCEREHPFTINRSLKGSVRTECERCGGIFFTPRQKQGSRKDIWINSKYSTQCKRCRKRIRVGAKVLWTPREGVMCKKCVDTEIELTRGEKNEVRIERPYRGNTEV